MDKRLGKSGVTLIELMVVVVIIGITAVLAVPAYQKMLPHMRLKSAARDVATAMQLARATAISKNAQQSITFNTTSDSFSFPPVSSTGWVDIDIMNDTQTSGLTGSPGTPPPDTYVPNLVNYTIEFRPDGTTTITDTAHHSPQRNYEAAYLENKRSPSEKYRVKVTGYTGIIKVEKWNGSAWE